MASIFPWYPHSKEFWSDLTQVLTLKDAVRLIAQRGRLIAEKCEAEAPSDGCRSQPTQLVVSARLFQFSRGYSKDLCCCEHCVIVEMEL